MSRSFLSDVRFDILLTAILSLKYVTVSHPVKLTFSSSNEYTSISAAVLRDCQSKTIQVFTLIGLLCSWERL